MNRLGTLRPVRIANCSGFYGDRATAMYEQVEGGEIDVLTGDYLAEVTMLILAKARIKRADAGYASTFLTQLDQCLETVASRGIRVVVNAGGLNPEGLAEKVRSLLAERQVELRVSYLEGDNLMPRLAELGGNSGLVHAETGAPLSSWGLDPICANAYLGAFGIAKALETGADIVITGRVADASLVAGAAAWWWGWDEADYAELAGAVAAGHVIECGPQACGGNFSGFRSMSRGKLPGFPIAEIESDGSATITKHSNTGGTVTVDTVTSQLLYEIGSPTYLNPDVSVHLDTVALAQLAPDRVRMSGTIGSPPPLTTKVSVCAVDGWRNSATLLLTGLDVDEKAESVEELLGHYAELPEVYEVKFERIGAVASDAQDQLAATSMLRVSIAGAESVAGRSFSSSLAEMALSGYPGFYMSSPPTAGQSRGVYWPGLIDTAYISQVVKIDREEPYVVRRVDHVRLPTLVADGAPHTQGTPRDWGATVAAPLGRVVHARSGDKGGNVNVGVWGFTADVSDWLLSALTLDAFQLLMPETVGRRIERHVFPNLGGLNFVIFGILGDGAASNLGLDAQGKGFGEWLRFRRMEVPERFLGKSAGTW